MSTGRFQIIRKKGVAVDRGDVYLVYNAGVNLRCEPS